MPVSVTALPERRQLDLRFFGNLDVSVTRSVCEICKCIPEWVEACVLDLTEVSRVFDSGVALLHMLCRRLKELGARVSIRGSGPEVGRWPELGCLVA